MKYLSRHQERELALQYLYSLDCKGKLKEDCSLEDLGTPLNLFADLESEDNYHEDLINGVCYNLINIDSLINENAIGWTIKRMARVDRNILRLAIFEIKYNPKVPQAVAINEAVELAKEYGSDKSTSFINGILGKIL